MILECSAKTSRDESNEQINRMLSRHHDAPALLDGANAPPARAVGTVVIDDDGYRVIDVLPE